MSCKLFLLGHSHGGRIAIKLVAEGKIKPDHLFLCAAAGIRHPRNIKRILGLTLAKTGKVFLRIRGCGRSSRSEKIPLQTRTRP